MVNKNIQGFDYCDNFSEDFARVVLNHKWNLISKNGNLISEQWFDSCDDFHEGLAKVKLNDKYNFIDKNGNLVFN